MKYVLIITINYFEHDHDDINFNYKGGSHVIKVNSCHLCLGVRQEEN